MFFSPLLLENFVGFSADGDRVTDGLHDGLKEKSIDVWMERNFPMKWSFGKFHPAILMGTSTMNLGGWMDGMDNRHTDCWTDFQMESHLFQECLYRQS